MFITFEPEVAETSGWLQDVPDGNTYHTYSRLLDVRRIVLHHVMSNKTCDICMFSKFVNFVPIDLKIGIYIDWTYTIYHAKNAPIIIT